MHLQQQLHPVAYFRANFARRKPIPRSGIVAFDEINYNTEGLQEKCGTETIERHKFQGEVTLVQAQLNSVAIEDEA